ncbi:hypothetical protein B0J13DRAFT_616759 [Dactylonectria estremocensis]|uniref:Uncharacterized protein n=1 Tax=Dactylonectria estremocensis TaxID=1079267 RepID=A0A9P9JFS6_9HYPO|nr:hypothetical protein B0J13DRAFT_616759 [Dactylonectria estremocensis]
MSGEIAPGIMQFPPRDGPPRPPQGQPGPAMHPANNRPMPSDMHQGVHPNMQHQNQPMMHTGPPQNFPPPPHHAVPQDLRSRKTIEFSDIRSERFTEADAREYLSSYLVIRLEKLDNPYDVDEEGYHLTPTWEKVRRITQTDISQQEIKRQVHVLERDTKSVAKKKAACTPPIQRQLECTQERLSQTDPDNRFCYKLVQFESKLRKLDDRELQYINKTSKKDKRDRKERKYVTTHSKKSKSKPKFERVSITAYFKRTPVPEISSLRMLEEHEREQQMRTLAPPQPSQQIPVPFQPAAHLMGGPAQFPMHPANTGPPPNTGPLPNPAPPAGVQVMQPKSIPQNNQPKQSPPNNQPKQNPQSNAPKPGVPAKPPVQVKKPDNGGKDGNQKSNQMKPSVQVITIGKNVKPHHDSSRSSNSSFGSVDSTSSTSTGSTPRSSLGSLPDSPKRVRGRSPTPVQRNTFPEHFGVPTIRQHPMQDKSYVLDSYPPNFTEQVPLPSHHFAPMDAASPLTQGRRPVFREDEPSRQDRRPIHRDVEVFGRDRRLSFQDDEPYRQDRHAFRRDDEAFGRDRRPSFRDEDPSYKPRTTLLPLRIYQKRGGVRLVDPSEARQEVFQDSMERIEDRLGRLRLDAAYRDDEFRSERLLEEPRRRVVLLNRFRDRSNEDAGLRERESRRLDRDAQDYMHRRDSDMGREGVHPFQPQGRRGIHRGH